MSTKSKTSKTYHANVTLNDDPKNDETNVVVTLVDRTKPTYTLANLARDLGHDPKNVRSRFRRFINDDDAKFNVIRKMRLENAKSRWVFQMKSYDAISTLIKRDDDSS